MKRKIFMLACSIVLLWASSCSKSSDVPSPEPEPPTGEGALLFPKKEMRAVWMTTAWGLDWPLGDYTEAGQKQKYIQYLDKFKQMNINAIFFQVRAMGDAYYNSAYEPWSASLTGARGNAPSYDVLKFLIDEAHARGIEFHAWMNPYRIATRAGTSTAYPALHSSINASWVVSHEKIQIYNPARPEVRERIVNIVKELISTYPVDGLHLDDYFYPDPASAGTMVSDQQDYETYGTGFGTIQAWRRDNVDKAIQGIHQAVVATRPEVVFSISPAANKDYNFNTLYADLGKWCQQGWVDLLIPQLYQEIGNSSNNFQTNLSIWAQYNYSAALVIGHGLYKFGDASQPAAFQTTQELDRQFNLTKLNKKAVGSAMYSAKYILDNKIGIADRLSVLYENPGVIPFMGRQVAAAPAVPGSSSITSATLRWTNTSGRSVVYRFSDLKAEGQVVAVTNANSLLLNQPGFYVITALNVDNQESGATVPIEFK
ncbi:glycoside hydrolase family 10 protein [Sphingobacterium bambusae]|uniref:Glycoside hydrolase family 10 protein n=1 Tax=Sphingobacterium bambusae TaxID=662858 RepID=A0ABW6BDU3_9SPHI|nr:family 10 glycosylhydrolase [Sphingobacterium bambusae]WPL46815.1 family 10 glycosylhydrolase [Sphingobacterium bambusae]